MAAISLSGAKTAAYKATKGAAVVGNGTLTLAANTFYEIGSVATTASTLPIKKVSAVFKSPDTSSTALVPAVGDVVYPLTLERICKTDAEVTLEEGTIDVTDDCEEGFNASILDGYRAISGSLNGFLKFDEATGVLLDGTKDLFGRFFNMVEDTGLGVYTVKPAVNERLLLFILLNNNVKVGDTQNFLIIPVLLNSMGTGAGLKDAQKRDMAWVKAQGYCSLYQRKVFAADII
jgi:hypothetical protein